MKPLDHEKHGITLHEEPVKTSYEKSGERHTSHSGFTQGDKVKLEAGGKQITGEFKHVNINKHSPKGYAVIRGEDGKLYERTLNKIDHAGYILKPEKKLVKIDTKSLSSGTIETKPAKSTTEKESASKAKFSGFGEKWQIL